VKDPLGIHARPAGLLVKKLQEFSSVTTILRGEDQCDGKKLLALMKMRVKEGQTLTFRFEGDDEDAAARSLGEYLAEIL
ncbi:MAG: HPr family phosphocarrier protein, partial [Treponema sp.]|nr:HPr family phosphocarrier protein [Treponema sp.]